MEAAHGFFEGRRSLGISVTSGGQGAFAEYANVPPMIGTLISSKMANLHELDTVYGTQDAYDLLEIVTIDAHNRAKATKE